MTVYPPDSVILTAVCVRSVNPVRTPSPEAKASSRPRPSCHSPLPGWPLTRTSYKRPTNGTHTPRPPRKATGRFSPSWARWACGAWSPPCRSRLQPMRRFSLPTSTMFYALHSGPATWSWWTTSVRIRWPGFVSRSSSRRGVALPAALLARPEPDRKSIVQAQTATPGHQGQNRTRTRSGHRRTTPQHPPSRRNRMVQTAVPPFIEIANQL